MERDLRRVLLVLIALLGLAGLALAEEEAAPSPSDAKVAPPAPAAPGAPAAPATPAAPAAPTAPAAPAAAASHQGCGCAPACECGETCGQACGCQSCGCCEGCCDGCCDPAWTVGADALFLKRTYTRNTALVTGLLGRDLLDTKDLDPGISTGWDINLIRHHVLGTAWGLEGRYFGLDGWDATHGPVASLVSVIHFETPMGYLDPAGTAGSYNSALHSLELNGRRDLGGWGDFIMGFRYIDLSETLTISQLEVFPLGAARSQIDAENFMAGFQIGVDAHLWQRGKLSIDGLAKFGAYDNSVGNRTTITVLPGPDYYSRGHEHHTAFLGEFALTTLYEVNEHVFVRAGLELLVFDGVAVASDQLAVSNPAVGRASVNTDGHPVYSGGFVGIELRR